MFLMATIAPTSMMRPTSAMPTLLTAGWCLATRRSRPAAARASTRAPTPRTADAATTPAATLRTLTRRAWPERARSDASAAQANIQAQLDAARKEGQDLVANAQGIATRIQTEAREQAARDRESALERARAEIALERDQAIAELRREFAGITVSAAEKVINQSLDRSAHQRLIEETLSQSSFREN